MTALTGTFWSPSYPLDYKNHASCKWQITVPSNYTLSVNFEDVILERTCCRCDYVEVWETLKNGSAVLITKFCDDTKPDPSQQFRSTSNSVTVIFRSDATVHERGFKARYQAIPVPGKEINCKFDMHASAMIYAGIYSQSLYSLWFTISVSFQAARYTLFPIANGRHCSILLFSCKLALVASFLSSKFKRIFSLKRGNNCKG